MWFSTEKKKKKADPKGVVLQGIQQAADSAVSGFNTAADFVASELLFAFSPLGTPAADFDDYGQVNDLERKSRHFREVTSGSNNNNNNNSSSSSKRKQRGKSRSSRGNPTPSSSSIGSESYAEMNVITTVPIHPPKEKKPPRAPTKAAPKVLKTVLPKQRVPTRPKMDPEASHASVSLPRPPPRASPKLNKLPELDEHGIMLDNLLSDVIPEVRPEEDYRDMDTVSTLSSGAPSKCQAIFRPQPKVMPLDATQRFSYLVTDENKAAASPNSPNRALMDDSEDASTKNGSSKVTKNTPPEEKAAPPRIHDIQTKEITSFDEEDEVVELEGPPNAPSQHSNRASSRSRETQAPYSPSTPLSAVQANSNVSSPAASNTPPRSQEAASSPKREAVIHYSPKVVEAPTTPVVEPIQPKKAVSSKKKSDILDLKRTIQLMERRITQEQEKASTMKTRQVHRARQHRRGLIANPPQPTSTSTSTSSPILQSVPEVVSSTSSLDIHTAPTDTHSNKAGQESKEAKESRERILARDLKKLSESFDRDKSEAQQENRSKELKALLQRLDRCSTRSQARTVVNMDDSPTSTHETRMVVDELQNKAEDRSENWSEETQERLMRENRRFEDENSRQGSCDHASDTDDLGIEPAIQDSTRSFKFINQMRAKLASLETQPSYTPHGDQEVAVVSPEKLVSSSKSSSTSSDVIDLTGLDEVIFFEKRSSPLQPRTINQE